MKTSNEQTELKNIVKTALSELLDERRELLRELLAEALEDIGLIRAMEEGMKSGPATREEVFEALQRPG